MENWRACLQVAERDKDKFNVVLYCVNCHYYRPKNVTIEEASDPMARPRAFYLNKAIKKAPLKVFKSGSATGPTAGELVGLTRESPPGLYEMKKRPYLQPQ